MAKKQQKGFAVMPADVQREIARKGGKAAHKEGSAHEWTREEASLAGKKGGIISQQRRREARVNAR